MNDQLKFGGEDRVDFHVETQLENAFFWRFLAGMTLKPIIHDPL